MNSAPEPQGAATRLGCLMVWFHSLWIVALALLIKLAMSPAPESSAPARPPGVTGPPPLEVVVGQSAREPVARGEAAQRALSLPAGPPVPSFESQCETRLPPTKVEVELAPQAVVFDFAHSIPALGAAAQKGEDGVILGLTKNGLGTQFQWHMNMLTDPLTNVSCMRPQIRMLVANGAQQVYVAREFERGGCAFNEVLEHEMHHANANRDQLALSALELRGTLKNTLGNRVFYGKRSELERQLTEAVNDHWMPMAKLKFSEQSPVHAEIDSEHGYRDVLSRCEGEFAQVLRSLRR